MISSMSGRLRLIDVPLVGLFALLSIATSALVSLAVSTPSAAGNYPANIMSQYDDYCYSNLQRFNSIGQLSGAGNFGLVNAIVNLPIYDWDQDPSLVSSNPLYQAYNLGGHNLAGSGAGLRGSLNGRSVGYAQDFNFRVTPVPNLHWMFNYITRQLPNDAGKLSWLTGAPNMVATVSGNKWDPYIANPFIYTQSALISSSGLPQFQAVTGPLTDLGQASQGNLGLDSVFRIDTMEQIANFNNYQLNGSSALVNELYGSGDFTGSGLGGMLNAGANIASASASDIKAFEAAAESLAGDLLSLPGISHLLSSPAYMVRGGNPADTCYEYKGASNQVPAYAFSVPRANAIPVTMPGWIFSIMTLIDKGEPSSSGMTAYVPGGSLNGKAMLDCYGRGVQPFVTGHDVYKVRDWAALGEGPASAGINFTIYAFVFAAGAAADIAQLLATGTLGGGDLIRQAGWSLPALVTKYETYTSGFAFMFRIENNATVLPAHLSNRVVDYRTVSATASKRSDINVGYFVGGMGHGESQNGQQFNPDIYLRLYKPYIVEPQFDLGSTPRETLDGHGTDVAITTDKYGFNAGNTLTNVGGTDYQPDEGATGGPTYDVNASDRNTARAFTDVQVYKMVIKPGTLVNAIDADKVREGGNAERYYSAQTRTAVSASTQPCDFFTGQLINGDSDTEPSRLTTNNSNANGMLPTPPAIENRALGEDANFTCGVVHQEQLKMDEGNRSANLFNERVEFDAETPAGTKVCYAVRYSNYTNDLKTLGNHWWQRGVQNNFNENYETPADKTYLSRANCIISGYKPSLQVRGGDLMTNGGVYTGVNVKEFLASTATPTKEARTYGSWVEYGIIAKESVNRMASGGLYRIGMPANYQNFGYLTFANTYTTGPEHGNYPGTSSEAGNVDDGFERVTRQFTSMSGRAQVIQSTDTNGDGRPDDINLSGLASGTYVLRGSEINLSTPTPLESNRSLILLIEELPGITPVVNIVNSIRTPVDYGAGSSVSDISQVVISPAHEGGTYRLNIGHEATQVDAWLLNPNGLINTCSTGLETSNVQNTPRAGSMCSQPLTVNGPVSAKSLLLRRDGGKDQGDTATIDQSIPAENFNLRPDAYIWAAHYVDSGGRKYVTTNSVDLPPRY